MRARGTLDDGRDYLIMDCVDGARLDRHCATLARTLDARLRLLIALCAAVHHAHTHALVHGDLKPANITVTGAGQPVVLDFGNADHAASATRGPRALTPRYASPEQLAGGALTTASDIYSLGVNTGELGDTAHPRPAARLRRQLATVLARATAEAPADRYASAAQLAIDLARVRDGERVRPPAPAVPSRAGGTGWAPPRW